MAKHPEEPDGGAERQGLYTNSFKVGFNAFEFVIDFGQAYEDAEYETAHTRIVTGPAYAKALAALLLQSLASYEASFGAIPDAGLFPFPRPQMNKDGEA
jgi:hypothetical protein